MRIAQTSLAAVSLLFALAGAAQADVLSDAKSRGELTCGVLGVNEPFGYQDVQTRETVGYEVDLCRLLGSKLGVKTNIKVVTSQSRVPELAQRRVDIIAALLSYTPERAEQVDFSNNYLADNSKCIVLADSKYKTLNDLAEARVAILKGSVLDGPFRERFPKATILNLDDTNTSFIALFQGKVAATCNRVSTARLIEGRIPNGQPTRFLPEALIYQNAGFAVKKGAKDFVTYLNSFLDQIEKSGEGDVIFAKWLGSKSPLKLEREFKFGGPLTN